MGVTSHRDHDELLVVRFASGDADERERAAAAELVAECGVCAAVVADIAAIARITTRETLQVPRRPRSFRLREEEARRLRPGGWREWLVGFGAPRYDLARPLAGAVATIGLVVAVAGSFPLFGQAATAPALGPTAEQPSPSAVGGYVPAPEATPGAKTTPTPQPTSGPHAAGPGATAEPAATAGESQGTTDRTISGPKSLSGPQAGGGQVPWTPIGIVLLASGVATVVLNSAARRRVGR